MNIQDFSFETHIQQIFSLVKLTSLTAPGDAAPDDLETGLKYVAAYLFRRLRRPGAKAIFVGNGGSAAICSHAALDFWNAAGLRAVAFTDAAMLTCVSNDHGYESVYARPIGMFAGPADVLVAVSSSGRSPNILKGVAAARDAGCGVVTFSGFSPENPLRKAGDINLYVACSHYGQVEVAHQLLLHVLSDALCALSEDAWREAPSMPQGVCDPGAV
jgi:D-sedoheptulose 7-phosphate isomerase